jgi:hypothetical protein
MKKKHTLKLQKGGRDEKITIHKNCRKEGRMKRNNNTLKLQKGGKDEKNQGNDLTATGKQ